MGFSAHARLLSFNENTTNSKNKSSSESRMKQQGRRTRSKKESAKPHQFGVEIQENERQNHTAHPATNEKSSTSNTHSYTTTNQNRRMLRALDSECGNGFWGKNNRRRGGGEEKPQAERGGVGGEG